MRAGLWGALLTGGVGIAGVVVVDGCADPPTECVDDDEVLKRALANGEREGRLRCPTKPGIDVVQDGGDCVPILGGAPVPDSCGIFVSMSGQDTNEGTKEKPVKTLRKGLELAKAAGRRVYACAEPLEEEPTGVSVAAGTRIFGGLDCAASAPNTWAYTDMKKTEVTAPEDQVPMRLEKGAGTELYSVRVWAKAAKAPGGSSIAVIANEATALFVRSIIEAGDGAPGVDGAPPASIAAAGQDGSPGLGACMYTKAPGGEDPGNGCSKGGNGGDGDMVFGGDGVSGDPAGSSNYGAGQKDAPGCIDGASGAAGSTGDGRSDATDLGSLDETAGYIGTAGLDGMPGKAGQGGGGGGGTRSKAQSNGPNLCGDGNEVGASGGSGASGGCGGAGGRGGGPGGASIAVVSIRSLLTFNASQINASNGAPPGSGAKGQKGGPGGVNGGAGGPGFKDLVKAGCDGGKGGEGGTGGRGGNGVGGHSIGIAYLEPVTTATPISLSSGTKITVGLAGAGGVSKEQKPFE